jgi:hypothetical protein
MEEKPKAKVRPPFVHSDKPREPVAAEESGTRGWNSGKLGAFDWKSAASLRAPRNPAEKAERAWAATEWTESASQISEEAKRVAEQLDSVAQKIRKGELSVNGKAPTPETAMAAALEALIRAK